MSLENKIVIVTGASRGIGEATARHLAAEGASVVLAARSSNAIEQIAAQIAENGNKAVAKTCDVSQYEDVKSLIDFTIEEFGAIDVLVNNAGLIDPIARLTDSDPTKWAHIVDTNFKGVYYALHSSIPHMIEKGEGTIINISSGAAAGALEGWSHYCSTKAAVLSLTRCAHKEYADQGLRIVGLSPGTVATDMQRQRKCAKAEREVGVWNREMQNLQREESALLRRQNNNNYSSIRAREVRAERVRVASCDGLPAPRAPRTTTTEAERAARDLAIGVAAGILGGILSRGGGHSHGGGNCRNNPLGANC
ncbi:MAG: SDR family oxidoreductase [Fimbriimonadaceae bacterium]|nr:SDR family oxidoreductase [Alphaproteobacteria bacterium]